MERTPTFAARLERGQKWAKAELLRESAEALAGGEPKGGVGLLQDSAETSHLCTSQATERNQRRKDGGPDHRLF